MQRYESLYLCDYQWRLRIGTVSQLMKDYLIVLINDFNLQIFPFDTLQKQRLYDEEYQYEKILEDKICDIKKQYFNKFDLDEESMLDHRELKLQRQQLLQLKIQSGYEIQNHLKIIFIYPMIQQQFLNCIEPKGSLESQRDYIDPWSLDLRQSLICIEPKGSLDLRQSLICIEPKGSLDLRQSLICIEPKGSLDLRQSLNCNNKWKSLCKVWNQIQCNRYNIDYNYYHSDRNIAIEILQQVFVFDQNDIKNEIQYM
ncbi:hypothetical protein ABPG72_018974 [Tetrahymena utriculariae]